MKQQENETNVFSGGHVLIVDDAAANRDLTALMLRRLGVTTDKAENGAEALEMMNATHYDVVLMDMHMPVMDGLTATRKIRQMGSDICVIALTAMTIEEEKQRCMDAGCDGFLTKPIRMPALIAGLSPYLPLVESECESTEASVDEPTRANSAPNHMEIRDRLCEEIESDLAKTLADLGIEDVLPQEQPTRGELLLPDVVRCSMSLAIPEMREIFEAFLVRLHERLPEFRDAWSKKDHSALEELGHWLAGAAGTMGLNEFVEPGRELENSQWTDPVRDAAVLEHIYALADRIETPVSY